MYYIQELNKGISFLIISLKGGLKWYGIMELLNVDTKAVLI